MEVNISSMKSEIDRVNSVIEEYENNLLNLKKDFNSVSFFWNGNLSDNFFEELNINLNKIDVNLEDLKSIKKLYEYILSQYENIGQNIFLNLSNKEKIFSHTELIIEKVDEIIGLYNSLDYNVDSTLVVLMEDERKKYLDIRKCLTNYYESLKKFYNKIEEIEKSVNQQIYKFQMDEYLI